MLTSPTYPNYASTITLSVPLQPFSGIALRVKDLNLEEKDDIPTCLSETAEKLHLLFTAIFSVTVLAGIYTGMMWLVYCTDKINKADEQSRMGRASVSLFATSLACCIIRIGWKVIEENIRLNHENWRERRLTWLIDFEKKYHHYPEAIIDLNDIEEVVNWTEPNHMKELLDKMSFVQQLEVVKKLGSKQVQLLLAEKTTDEEQAGTSIETRKTLFLLDLEKQPKEIQTENCSCPIIQQFCQRDSRFKKILEDRFGINLILNSHVDQTKTLDFSLVFLDEQELILNTKLQEILKKHSLYFRNLFSEGWRVENRISVDTNLAYFKKLLDICEQKVALDLSEDDWITLLDLADQFLFPQALEDMQNYILENQIFSKSTLEQILEKNLSASRYPILMNFYETYCIPSIDKNNVCSLYQMALKCGLKMTQENCKIFVKKRFFSFLPNFKDYQKKYKKNYKEKLTGYQQLEKKSVYQKFQSRFNLCRQILSEEELNAVIIELKSKIEVQNLPLIYDLGVNESISSLKTSCMTYCESNRESMNKSCPWPLEDIPSEFIDIFIP